MIGSIEKMQSWKVLSPDGEVLEDHVADRNFFWRIDNQKIVFNGTFPDYGYLNISAKITNREYYYSESDEMFILQIIEGFKKAFIFLISLMEPNQSKIPIAKKGKPWDDKICVYLVDNVASEYDILRDMYSAKSLKWKVTRQELRFVGGLYYDRLYVELSNGKTVITDFVLKHKL
jgi:hypothetical protein